MASLWTRIAPLASTRKDRKAWALAQTGVDAEDWQVLRLLLTNANNAEDVSSNANKAGSAAKIKKCKKRKAEQAMYWQKMDQAMKKQKMDQAMYWRRKRWADDKPAGTQIVLVQRIFATPQVDQSKLLEVQEGQYLYLLGYTADGWAQCQANELGIPKQIGFVPTQSLALFSEEEVARWSPVAPVAAAPSPVVAAAAPSADELAKLKASELKEQLRKRGLTVSGKKEELVARLLAGWGRACSF
jgi:hypothetical protein